MAVERERIIEKALKLRELANRGIGGEKTNAIEKLKNFKEKHGITDAELGSFIPIETSWQRSQDYNERDTPFSKWFRNSCAVDYKTNEPMVFFHKSRTPTMFHEFKHDVGIKYDASSYGFAFVHEDDARYIRHIGNSHLGYGVEFRCYLKMINPYYIYAKLNGNCYGQNGEPHIPIYIDKSLCEKLMAEGYDSIVVQSETELNCYIVFHSNQIKSVDNNGNYDPDNNNIFG